MAAKLESDVEFITNDDPLIPKSDLSVIGTKRTKFNSKPSKLIKIQK